MSDIYNKWNEQQKRFHKKAESLRKLMNASEDIADKEEWGLLVSKNLEKANIIGEVLIDLESIGLAPKEDDPQ